RQIPRLAREPARRRTAPADAGAARTERRDGRAGRTHAARHRPAPAPGTQRAGRLRVSAYRRERRPDPAHRAGALTHIARVTVRRRGAGTPLRTARSRSVIVAKAGCSG